ncbi:MAG: hypothetical protein HGA61_02845 [Candidatus Moranbacteria bacterium]|nr:hypothetical protein [Candidatus Moranbacteria bacterium]
MQEKNFFNHTQKKSSETSDKKAQTTVSLERLRQFRGDDEAVVEVTSDAEQQGLLDTLENPQKNSREKLMSEMFKNFSGKEYGDYQWSQYTGGWTTPKIPTLYGEFRNSYGNFVQLSLDAGFITHLPEFFQCAQNGELENLDYEAVRDLLKEKLGDKIAWRGMMLSIDELEDIKRNGIMSPFTKYLGQADHPKEEFSAKILSTNIHELIERHFHGENWISPFISVSEEKNIAISVGRHFGQKGRDKKFYLLKLKVPEIDLISYAEHGVKKPSKLQALKSNLSISVDGDESKHEWDKSVESYLFWKINPEEILEITQPEVTESAWNNQKTIGRI